MSTFHAEVGEDFAEDVFGGEFTGDFAEPVESFADNLAQGVTTESAVKAIDSTANGISGSGECLIVAGIRDYYGVTIYIMQDCIFDDELTLGFNVYIAFDADSYDWCTLGQKIIQLTPINIWEI